MRRIVKRAVLTAALLAPEGAAQAENALCADPGATCGAVLDQRCFDRFSAGAISTTGDDVCEAQLAAYKQCLGRVAVECTAPPEPTASECDRETARAVWEAVQSSQSPGELTAFADSCADSPFAAVARARARDLRSARGESRADEAEAARATAAAKAADDQAAAKAAAKAAEEARAAAKQAEAEKAAAEAAAAALAAEAKALREKAAADKAAAERAASAARAAAKKAADEKAAAQAKAAAEKAAALKEVERLASEAQALRKKAAAEKAAAEAARREAETAAAKAAKETAAAKAKTAAQQAAARKAAEELAAAESAAEAARAAAETAAAEAEKAASARQAAAEAARRDEADRAAQEAAIAETARAAALARDAQRELKRLRLYAGGVDGLWGPASASALKRFQASLDRPATGAIDEGLLAALKAAPTPVAASNAAPAAPQSSAAPSVADPAVRKAVAVELSRLGYYSGSAASGWTPQAREALLAFQRATGREADGSPSASMLAALKRIPSGAAPAAAAKPKPKSFTLEEIQGAWVGKASNWTVSFEVSGTKYRSTWRSTRHRIVFRGAVSGDMTLVHQGVSKYDGFLELTGQFPKVTFNHRGNSNRGPLTVTLRRP